MCMIVFPPPTHTMSPKVKAVPLTISGLTLLVSFQIPDVSGPVLVNKRPHYFLLTVTQSRVFVSWPHHGLIQSVRTRDIVPVASQAALKRQVRPHLRSNFRPWRSNVKSNSAWSGSSVNLFYQFPDRRDTIFFIYPLSIATSTYSCKMSYVTWMYRSVTEWQAQLLGYIVWVQTPWNTTATRVGLTVLNYGGLINEFLFINKVPAVRVMGIV